MVVRELTAGSTFSLGSLRLRSVPNDPKKSAASSAVPFPLGAIPPKRPPPRSLDPPTSPWPYPSVKSVGSILRSPAVEVGIDPTLKVPTESTGARSGCVVVDESFSTHSSSSSAAWSARSRLFETSSSLFDFDFDPLLRLDPYRLDELLLCFLLSSSSRSRR